MADEAAQLKKIKDPDAVLDYLIDWSDWLPEGDTIVDSIWLPETGITVHATSHTTTTATVWLEGGTVPEKYTVTNRVTTDGGRIDDRSLIISIKQR